MTYRFTEQQAKFDLYITEHYAPKCTIRVDLVGHTDRRKTEANPSEATVPDAPRPAFASGSTEIEVWPVRTKLI